MVSPGYILIYRRFILDDRVAYRAHLVDLAAEVVLAKGWKLLAVTALIAMHASLRSMRPSDSVLGNDGGDVNVTIRGALDSLFVLVDILHLASDVADVQVGRHLLLLKPFHYLGIFNVDSLRFLLLVNKVE